MKKLGGRGFFCFGWYLFVCGLFFLRFPCEDVECTKSLKMQISTSL